MDIHNNTSEEVTSARGTRSAVDLVSEVEVTDRATSDRIKCLIGYPMGRSDSSKPTPDGQPQQHFGGRSSSLRRPEGSIDRRSGRGPPRERQSTQEVSIPTDVDKLAHSDVNKIEQTPQLDS
ncbi:hypothetical protein B296_00044308 [Ensete ventricosum]|uniref:Uncharacterized protein n=1 Tax=Ensete ventricosum TaxID=4639 RepID=A0A426WZV0_ENSVE|nr:hypothetical protein B296_00044308 [Ensete ventricosum]